VIALYHPLRSLREGHWFKLICGASFQHLPAIRSLVLAYALAGADCVDVAADPAVVSAARDALHTATRLGKDARRQGFLASDRPWLMVSLNDGDDPHFRKAEFNPLHCPEDCPRPCQTVCPADAICFDDSWRKSGVIRDRCYGCGRCLPVCPIQHITTRSHQLPPAELAPLVLAGVDALEIHTQVGRFSQFQTLWRAIAPFLDRLQLVAISCPDGDGLIDYLRALADLILPLPGALVWQTDGRPMSGDIGRGTTHATIRLAQKVLQAGLPGYVQAAGGTNGHTITKLRSLGLVPTPPEPFRPAIHVAGVAYGSYARRLLTPVLDQLEPAQPTQPVLRLEQHPLLLGEATAIAQSLVSQLKPLVPSDAACSPPMAYANPSPSSAIQTLPGF